jgi:hypothetical protein
VLDINDSDEFEMPHSARWRSPVDRARYEQTSRDRCLPGSSLAPSHRRPIP